MAMLMLTGWPSAVAASAISAVVTETCNPPRPISLWRMSQSARGSNSRPMMKSIITTPNSAKCCRLSVSEPTSPAMGPMITPATRYPSTEPSPSRTAMGTAAQAASR